MKQFVFLVSMSMALAAVAEKQPLSRYQSIIDRQMFGPVPADFDPTKSPTEVAKSSSASRKELTQEQEKLQSSVVFSVINLTPEGETAVGFTDNSDPKAPKHYYLKVGETKDGWTVKEASAAEASMTIVKDDIEVSLKIGDNSAKGGGSTARSGATLAGAADGRRSGLLGGGLGSLRSRRQMRLQQQQQAQAAADAAAAQKEADRQAQAAAEKAERDAEREQQRQQLMAIQEELRKAREQRQQQEAAKDEANNPE